MNNYGTILVVDDNPGILTAVKICLADVFERIITLSTPDNIISTLQQEKVDVVLLDMNFSLGVNTGQDGLFWLQTIVHHHPNIPVVLVTAYADVIAPLKTFLLVHLIKLLNSDFKCILSSIDAKKGK